MQRVLSSRVACATRFSRRRCIRFLSVDAAAAQSPVDAAPAVPRQLPAPPKIPEGFKIYSKRGFIEGDPMPDRPPEDDLALSTRYFESIVILYMLSKESGFVMERAVRLVDPRNLVNLVSSFASTQQPVPIELLQLLDDRFDAAALSELDGHYLSALAYGVYAQGNPPLPELFSRIAARAVELGGLAEADYANLATALGAAGVPLPDAVQRLPDPQ